MAFPGRSCSCVAIVWVDSRDSHQQRFAAQSNIVEVGDVDEVDEVVEVVEVVAVVEVVEVVGVEVVEAYRRRAWQEPCMGMRYMQQPAQEAKLPSPCALGDADDMLAGQEAQYTCLLVVPEQ